MTTTVPAIAIRPGHVGLNVTDLARSRDFYTGLLDLQPMGAGSGAGREWVYLGREGQILLTLWQQSAGSFAPTVPGLHHLALQVASVGELHHLADRLAELGVERRYSGVVLHAEGADSGGIYFSDPDGIRLEVYAPSGVAATGASAEADFPACGHF